MKLLLLAALVAVTVAAPRNGLVTPIAAGPEPVIVPDFQPIAIGPAIIGSFEPVAIGPAIIDEPIPVGPAVVGSPVPEASAPLVQIILNIKQAATSVPAAPVVVPQPTPNPVQVVDISPVPAEPVQVAESAPVPIEPVVIGTPVIPLPAVNLPDELN